MIEIEAKEILRRFPDHVVVSSLTHTVVFEDDLNRTDAEFVLAFREAVAQ